MSAPVDLWCFWSGHRNVERPLEKKASALSYMKSNQSKARLLHLMRLRSIFLQTISVRPIYNTLHDWLCVEKTSGIVPYTVRFSAICAAIFISQTSVSVCNLHKTDSGKIYEYANLAKVKWITCTRDSVVVLQRHYVIAKYRAALCRQSPGRSSRFHSLSPALSLFRFMFANTPFLTVYPPAKCFNVILRVYRWNLWGFLPLFPFYVPLLSCSIIHWNSTFFIISFSLCFMFFLIDNTFPLLFKILIY